MIDHGSFLYERQVLLHDMHLGYNSRKVSLCAIIAGVILVTLAEQKIINKWSTCLKMAQMMDGCNCCQLLVREVSPKIKLDIN